MDVATKTRENRLRRVAQRRGLVLKKNPRRDPRALDYGSYMLVDQHTGNLVADFGWAYASLPDSGDWLTDVEAYLDRDEAKAALAASGKGEG